MEHVDSLLLFLFLVVRARRRPRSKLLLLLFDCASSMLFAMPCFPKVA
jgi:hypothetical protein